ncbi:MAG: hypothetical protein R2762_15120 [Bryobacteraceae bacterium]
MRANSTVSKLSLSITLTVAAIWVTAGCSREAAPGPTGQTSPDTPARDLPVPPAAAVPAVVTEAQPAHSSAPQPVVIAAGTRISVRTAASVSTKTARSGDAVEASLAAPLMAGGRQVAAQGSRVLLRVVESGEGGRVRGRARLALRVAEIDGIAVQTGAYRVEAPATKKQDAMKIGIGSGLGAAIGAISGGGKGAAIGAAAGGGAGTGVVLATHGAPAVIPAEARLVFRLTAPMHVI